MSLEEPWIIVSIVTVYGLDDQGVGVQVLVGSKMSSSPHHPDWLLGPPNLLSNGYWGLYPPGVKQLGHEADHSTPATAKVKKMWIHISTPPYTFMA
jgi:hypothetical protein